MNPECCQPGSRLGGDPVGFEAKLAGNKSYIVGNSKSAAILIVHDVFGWKLRNSRLIADFYAKEANATVYLPDL
jgi:hypothetical protein